jgi:hypothetical protein
MPTQKLSPKYFFFSLASLAALITSVTALLDLVFETLNQKFPDVLNANYGYDSMRSALATLVIALPVFLAVSYFWNREKVLGSVDQVIRKWMIYLILFLSASVVIGDLITLVRYFISGEITTRFILKVAVALAVALKVGLYYIYLLQERKKVFGFRISIWAPIKASVLVLLAVGWSFWVMGSPATARAVRFDNQRIGDLQNIQWQVINYYQQKAKLPSSLSDLNNPLSGFSLPIDPENKAYAYKVSGKLTFSLCADFSLESRANPQLGRTAPTPTDAPGSASNYQDQNWAHPAGMYCFARTIDPDLYPPFKKQI